MFVVCDQYDSPSVVTLQRSLFRVAIKGFRKQQVPSSAIRIAQPLPPLAERNGNAEAGPGYGCQINSGSPLTARNSKNGPEVFKEQLM
jgi:hypothetical protein